MTLLSYLAAALLVLGIAAGLRAAFVPIRDNIDKFMEDPHRQGWWAAIAGLLAAAASLSEQALKFLG